MEISKEILIKSEYIDEVKDILDEVGLDIDAAVKMFFKRIIKEQNISFLLSSIGSAVKKPDEKYNSDETNFNINEVRINKMTKSLAISLFRKYDNTFAFRGNVSFSSKNRATNVYWSNPPFEYLDNDWNLILNDYHNKKLHLFVIPAKTIRYDDLRPRADIESLIDLQIAYGDPTFTDTRSIYGFSFAKYLKNTIQY